MPVVLVHRFVRLAGSRFKGSEVNERIVTLNGEP
jgi:hypothetical protein